MNTLLLFLGGFIIGFIFCILIYYYTSTKTWVKIGIVYVDYEWFLLYCRDKGNGIKKFKHVRIQKYGSLSTDVIEKIENI